MNKDIDKTVAIYGAGIAGLSAAHELAKRGWKVSVYETNADAGGFFRSARVAGDHNMPSEYSWHGLGPWYHNVFDLLRQIPFDAAGSVYQRALSRPIAFGVGADDGQAAFNDDTSVLPSIGKMDREPTQHRILFKRECSRAMAVLVERKSVVNLGGLLRSLDRLRLDSRFSAPRWPLFSQAIVLPTHPRPSC
jgi:uncharacterized protein with NAD-binding domain and iron-sulfur cluster